MSMLTRLMLSGTILALFAGSPLNAQTKAKAENVATIPHTSVPNFFKLPPDLYFGEGIGIATNSKGHVFVYHRGIRYRVRAPGSSGCARQRLGGR
jgi:hypothetical protein